MWSATKRPMPESARTQSIVAGIDGSKAAIRAALWAVDEAVSRGVPLRLLHATERDDAPNTRSWRCARR